MADQTVRARATVVRATAPPAGLFGLRAPWWVSAVTDLGAGPILLRSAVRLDPDRWLLPGSEVTLIVAPDPHPVHGFEIDWDSVPPIAHRVKIGDRAVADPIRSQQIARELRKAATATYVDPSEDLYWQLTDERATGPAELDEALARLGAAGPINEGWRRAVVVVAGLRRVIQTGEPMPNAPAGTPQMVTFEPGSSRGNQAAAAVHLPGEPAYAVLIEQFAHPAYKDVEGCLPALVATSDPTRIEIQWDEVPAAPDLTSLMTDVAYQER
jgi:hypothetical protein